MIKHIVMFKVSKADNQFDDNMTRLSRALTDLDGKIPEIKFFEVGRNISNSPNAADLVLVSEFGNEEELERYREHPEHLKVLELIKEICTEVRVTDYQLPVHYTC
ncbi:MAG: Dabb family protein [Bacteroidota bacterium]